MVARKEKVYPWTADTFPQVDDDQYDLLCVLEDSGGLLDLSDILFSLSASEKESGRVQEQLDFLLSAGLVSRLKQGQHTFYRLSRNGDLYLNSPPPSGISI